MTITPWQERADCDWQAEIDELRASAATDAHLLELGQDTAKRLCDELAALKAQPVQEPKSTLVSIIEEKIAGMTPSEVVQFMRDRAALAAPQPMSFNTFVRQNYADLGAGVYVEKPEPQPVKQADHFELISRLRKTHWSHMTAINLMRDAADALEGAKP